MPALEGAKARHRLGTGGRNTGTLIQCATPFICNREKFRKQVILELCSFARGWCLEASVQGSHDDGQDALQLEAGRENPFTEAPFVFA